MDMLKVKLPDFLANECKKCKKGTIVDWDAPELSIKGKDEVVIPFKIHLANYKLDSTKFKLIANGPKPGKYFCNTCSEFFN